MVYLARPCHSLIRQWLSFLKSSKELGKSWTDRRALGVTGECADQGKMGGAHKDLSGHHVYTFSFCRKMTNTVTANGLVLLCASRAPHCSFSNMRSPAKHAIKTEQTSCLPYSLMSLAQGKCCSNNHRGLVACSLTLNVKGLEREENPFCQGFRRK